MKYPSKVGYQNWEISQRPSYKYRLFNKRHRTAGIWPSKLFLHSKECDPRFYSALTSLNPEGYLPAVLGADDKGGIRTIDWLDVNTLIGGQTQSGKTSFLHGVLLSTIYFSSPEYVKVVILDMKSAGYAGLDGVASVNKNEDEIFAALKAIDAELARRKKLTSMPGAPMDAKTANQRAFAKGDPALAMPYIFVLFDEFADFLIKMELEAKEAKAEGREEKGKKSRYQEAKAIIHSLCSTGLGLGINLTFATQAPYAEVVAGVIKNNFERRITFQLGEERQRTIVMGSKPDPSMIESTSGLPGSFHYRENGHWKAFQAIYVGEKERNSMANACRNLKNWGFNYTPDFLKGSKSPYRQAKNNKR